MGKIGMYKHGGIGAWIGLLAVVAALALGGGEARAEYGDIVMNQYSDAAGIRPVVFPHWFHRVRFSCKACHSDLGIKFKTGGNEMTMVKVMDGLYCGACHNGKMAWTVENCDLCHTGVPGMPTQTHENTIQRLPGSAGSGAGKR